MSLMTPEEARTRWPESDYPSDTLGGCRRDVILKAWDLIDELRERVRDTEGQELGEVLIAAFVADLTQQERRIDELQSEALATAFRQVMGYELPAVDQ